MVPSLAASNILGIMRDLCTAQRERVSTDHEHPQNYCFRVGRHPVRVPACTDNNAASRRLTAVEWTRQRVVSHNAAWLS
jgi:hypothetical protein